MQTRPGLADPSPFPSPLWGGVSEATLIKEATAKTEAPVLVRELPALPLTPPPRPCYKHGYLNNKNVDEDE
jgi:hypothetical protein